MIHITNLCLNGVHGPVVFDDRRPRFSWTLKALEDVRGLTPTAHRVTLREREGALLCDSGWDLGNETFFRFPEALNFRPDTEYEWTVSVRWADLDGRAEETGESASSFRTGLLEESDWRGAKWIGAEEESDWLARWDLRKLLDKDRSLPIPASKRCEWRDIWAWRDLYQDVPIEPDPVFGRAFDLPAPPVAATLYISGLGYAEPTINGVRVGDDVLDPAWTDYRRTVCYRGFDVTSLLRAGENRIECIIGRGFYCLPVAHKRFNKTSWLGQPKLIVCLRWRDSMGNEGTLVSDATWEVAESRVVFESHWPGEIQDSANADPALHPAAVATTPAGTLRCQPIPGIRTFEPIAPVTVEKTGQGRQIFSFPTVIGGRVRLRLPKSEKGRRITVSYSERPPTSEGLLPWRHVYQQFGIVEDGTDDRVYEPLFTTSSFVYVMVEGYPGKLTLDDVQAVPVRSPLPPIVAFSCDVPVINRIHEAVGRTLAGNWMGLPTDCPNREKVGWTGDGHLACEAIHSHFAAEPFFQKWIGDFRDAQLDSGQFPAYVPAAAEPLVVDPNWSAVTVLAPWNNYVESGDVELLAGAYPMMKRYALSIGKACASEIGEHIVRGRFGDWLPPDSVAFPWAGPETGEPYGTAFYYIVVRCMATIARTLKKEDDASTFDSLADRIAEAFHAAFYRPDEGCYGSCKKTGYRQSIQAVALVSGVVPEELRKGILTGLVEDIRDVRHDHLNTGFVGTKALLEVLFSSGKADLAARLVAQTTFPSWGYWLEHQDGTSIAENWFGVDETGTLNHPPLCSVGAFIIRHIGGIRPDPEMPGYRRILFEPKGYPVVKQAMTRLQTPRGEAACSWQVQDGKGRIEIEVPPGCEGVVKIPFASFMPDVAAAADQRGGVKTLSGKYIFTFSL